MARWWEHPQLWSDDPKVERKVGFLDLFYDLIFVVAIAQIAHGLAKHPDQAGVIDFTLLVLPVFWLWIGHTFYADRFENRDISYIFYTFVSMIPVVGLAVFAHDGRGDTAAGFAISYAVGRLILVGMYARAAVRVPAARRPSKYLALGFGAGALLWLGSAFVADPVTRTGMQLLGLAWDFYVPVLVAPAMRGLPDFSEHRLRERFGLIMIIVLGESIAGTANGLADVHHFAWRHGLTAVFAMVFAFGLYFTYFEMVPREKLRSWRWASMTRSYLHLALICAITATGAGVLATVGHEAEVLADGVRQLLAGALAVAYLVLVGLSRTHEYAFAGAGRKGTESALWVAIAAALAIGLFGSGLNSLQVLGLLSIAASVPWVVGVNAWRRYTRELPKQAEQPTQG